MVKWGDVCTFGFLFLDGPVARPGYEPGRIQKAKSATNERNHPGLPSIYVHTTRQYEMKLTARRVKRNATEASGDMLRTARNCGNCSVHGSTISPFICQVRISVITNI